MDVFHIFMLFCFQSKIEKTHHSKSKITKAIEQGSKFTENITKSKKKFWLHDFVSISVFVAHAEKEKSFVLLQYDDMQKLCSVL